MTDESPSTNSEQARDRSFEVISQALTSMREDESAQSIADALERAWSDGRFDVETALREIQSSPEGQEGAA